MQEIDETNRRLADIEVLVPANDLTRVFIGIGGFLLLFVLGLYVWWVNRSAVLVEPNTAPPAGSVAAPQAISEQQMQGTVNTLVERLNRSPGDVEAWITLGRTYLAMGKIDEAVKAQRQVVKLDPKNAHAFADLADSLAIANGRNLEGEPARALAQALALDPHHVKALALSGTLARNRGQIEEAGKFWEQALKGAEPGTPMANQLQRAIAQVHAYVATKSKAASESPAATPALAHGKASISGRVLLSEALKTRVSPDDVVFIYARGPQEGAPPLAVVRKQVKDLPFDFRLDDAAAPSPSSRLSLVKEARIGARISKSGNANSQPSDFQTNHPGMVPVGSKGVNIEISEFIR
jgi:cytochrome c-type biogenesis protein CcmH